jgi:TonB family protein
MKRIFLFIFISRLIFSCTPDGKRMSDQMLDSIAAQNDQVDTFSVEKNKPLSDAQKIQLIKGKKDSAKIISDTLNSQKANVSINTNSSALVLNPDVFPAFPGGEIMMQEYIKRHLQYPLVAFQNEIKGIVNVKFVVETDGTLTGITVIQGLGYGCDESATDLIRKMPKWIPGKKAGVNVRCAVVLPLSYGE